MSMVVTISFIGALLLLQGFFSGSEIALVSADRLQLQADSDRGRTGAAIALKMLSNPARMLGTCLVGTNLCAIAIATLGAHLVIQHLHAHPAITVLLVVPFTLTIGELIPKALYQHHANMLVPILAFPLRTCSYVLTPILWVFDRVTRILGGALHAQHPITREEIRLLLEATQDPAITPEDKALIRRVFAFTEAVVEEAMVPLIHVIAVPETTTCAEAAERMIESGHSRLPLYAERIDQISGMLIHQDLMAVDDWRTPISEVARPPMFVPETKRVDQLLLDMRRARQRMAVVVDEYGGAVGIITVEDLVEEIVGEIEDESDQRSTLVRRVGKNEWIAAGRAEREHLEAACGLLLPDGDFETIAGFMLSALGRIPRIGEHIALGQHTLTTYKVNDRAILEVHLRDNMR